jgi:hypothetical protein
MGGGYGQSHSKTRGLPVFQEARRVFIVLVQRRPGPQLRLQGRRRRRQRDEPLGIR